MNEQQTMTLSEYARHHNVSLTAVGKWRDRGVIVMDDDRVDVAKSDEILAARPDVYRGGLARGQGRTVKAPASPGRKPSAMSRAVARKEEALASLREFDLEKKRGQYCDIEITCQLVEANSGVIRERLLAVPGKLANQLAHQPRQICFDLLQAEINAILRELHAPAEIARRAAEAAKDD